MKKRIFRSFPFHWKLTEWSEGIILRKKKLKQTFLFLVGHVFETDPPFAAAQIPIKQSATLKPITTDSIACNQKLSGVDTVYPPWATFSQFT